MNAHELLKNVQPHLRGMADELPEGPARTAARVAAGAAPAILDGMKDAMERDDSTSQTAMWLETAASLMLQQLPKVLPKVGAIGIATSAVIQFLPDIIALVTIEQVHVVYEKSDMEHPPELV